MLARETCETSGKEVLGTSNTELRIAPFSYVLHFTRHGLWRWRTFHHSANSKDQLCLRLGPTPTTA